VKKYFAVDRKSLKKGKKREIIVYMAPPALFTGNNCPG